MNYSNYFPVLKPIEDRLFKEKYWQLGFVNSNIGVITSSGEEIIDDTPIIFKTQKWSEMIFVIGCKYDLNKYMISEDMLLEYMDNPNRRQVWKKYDKKRRKENAAERYKAAKTRNSVADKEGDTQA